MDMHAHPCADAFSARWILVAGLLCAAASAHAAEVREISVDTHYISVADHAVATVSLAGAIPSPAGTTLRVTEVRQVDLPSDSATKPGEASRIVFDRPLSEVLDARVAFELRPTGILAGKLQLRAEILGAAAAPLSVAWSDIIEVGVRPRVSLAGEWEVSKIEPYDVAGSGRPAAWKTPELKSVRLPGVILNDEWFRGWVTVQRDLKWTKAADLQARFIRLSGVTDSAAVSIDSTILPETRPIEEMAVLTHWIEFHSKYKGEENARTRMLFLDLPPQGPVKIVLPGALPPEGSARVTMRIRATSGMFRQHPMPGIRGDLHLDLTPPVYVKDISFDTDKAGDNRRFKFQLVIGNESGKPFHGKLRSVYGRYDGKIAYTGNCPEYAAADQVIDLKPGTNTVEVLREEMPRFDTCRATFLLLGDADKILDGDGINFHTVTFEIRDRRDFYLNNERFITKAQGSSGDAPHMRWQLRVMGGNAFRGPTDPALINLYQSEGLLTSAGGALLASVEKCTFYNPQDTSNIYKAVKGWTTALADCPGVIDWEATNELHGEPEEAREAMLDAFHKLDPYHRPVLATKGSGEWEAEARDGRVKGVDIVGCQYLLSKEGVDSITAAVTEQPIMSTEVNWNDSSFSRDNLWSYWLEKGIAGSLLFDYSGGALDQPVPTVPPPDNDPLGLLIKRSNRDLYQDLVATATQQADGRVLLKLGNQMPYTLHHLGVRVRDVGRVALPDMSPGAATTVLLPRDQSPALKETLVLRAEYMTHGGLPHIAILTPTVTAAPAPASPAANQGGVK